MSVVIPVLNGERTIGDLLRALRSQLATPANVETIVVDNGSTDRTRDIVREAGVTLLEELVPGPAAARNRGLRCARGDIIAHVDADTLPTRRWLSEIVVPFADPGVVLVAGRTLGYRADTGAERYVSAAGVFETEFAVGREEFPWAPSLNMAVRREAALAIDGWTVELHTGEDVDFSHRLCKAFNCEIVYAPRAILFHKHRTTDEQLRKQARSYGEGVALIYRRYPDEIRWDARKSMILARQLAARTVSPPFLRMGSMIGLVNSTKVEFARYHRLWSWEFWRGFASVYRRKEFR